MPQAALFLLIILLGSLFFNNSYSFLGGDLPQQYQQNSQLKLEHTSGIVKINSIPMEKQNQLKRYLIFGSGASLDANSEIKNQIYTIESQNGFFSAGVISENKISKLQSQGFYVIEDFLVDLHSSDNSNNIIEISRIGDITGSEMVHQNYNLTGAGIKIAVIDTGVDFSNLDIRHSLARDKDNIPIMLDADGQGIILTNATFIANIDENGILRNFTKSLPEDVTSKIYRTKKGVFLDIYQNGNGTIIEIYNSFYPQAGFAPIFNGTLTDDMKIGTNNRDYIVSKSGIYHLGIMYQGALQGPFTRVQVVPVLVVDSVESGVYDTIIPDMSTSWEDYTRFDLPTGERPNYDFDFTDETPIKLGSGNEFLIYDFDDDGKLDYSAGTIGAQVLDIYGVVQNKTSTIDKTLKAINGTLLPPMDPNGEFFGVMTDFVGHGTSSAASITSKGSQEYDIYNNTKKYTIKGVAPGAQIIPVKALWFGDTVYAWLWSAGFENNQTEWKFTGKPRADIISNSWGVSNFPSLNAVPGMDILSLILNVLVTPQSLDFHYPGVLMVTSAGNSGHGYGTLGLPSASTLAITVGATTNNVFVGYGSFKDQPRFGNTTEHSNNVVDFSSRGPGYIGDPKPDLMSIGAYSFTPSQVTKLKKDSTKDPFSLFGGTSMGAPLVSGSAALVMESLNKKFEEYDPLEIKNILMSTATDLYNDPFTQGAGLVNVFDAIKFVEHENGMFIVYNDATYSNIKDILDSSVERVNSTVFGIKQFQLPDKKIFHTSWFGGQLFPGERSSTTFTIENPSDESIEISIKPQTIELIQKTQFQGTTEPQIQDPILNETGTFAPNYIRLSDVKEHETLASLYDESNPIPSEATLMVLNVNFPFETFMNKTDDMYANDLKISSLYLYDWNDKNEDNDVASDELSMINRGGSWGTVQEIRITQPNEKFEHTPLVGIYPVPTRYSYWIGDTQKNSTLIDYTLSSSYYKKAKWDVIWTSADSVTVPPDSLSEVTVTIIAPINSQSGVYQGFLTFEGDKHTVNVPVSYVVKKKIEEKDSVVLIPGQSGDDVLYGNGYVKGAFDMVNRYMAGDWRQYYFDIEDPTINTAAIDISWESDDTNLSVFVIDPQGRIAQTNMPSGVFGHFLGWPSLDWLGTSPFSQGGGFFPVKNKEGNSTVLYVPVNQTGTYGMLIHSTLFGGNSTTEPINIAAKFTTISHDLQIPEIIEIPNFVHEDNVTEQVEDEKLNDSSIDKETIVEDEKLNDSSIDKETIEEQKIPDESFNIVIGILIGIAIGVAALIPLVIRKKKILTKQ